MINEDLMHTFYEDKNVQLSVFCFPFGIFCFPPTEGFIKYDERLSSDRGGKLQTMKKVVKHNVHLIHHYPAEIIWPPIWFVWHKCWKTGMRLKVKSSMV